MANTAPSPGVDVTSPNGRDQTIRTGPHRYHPYLEEEKYDSYKSIDCDLYEVPDHDKDGSGPLPTRVAARATYNIIALAGGIDEPVRRALLSLIEDWIVGGVDVGSWIDVREMIAHYSPETRTYTERAEPL